MDNDKLVINATIGRLLELQEGSPAWLELARVVVEYASQIPSSNLVTMHSRVEKPGDSISGQTTLGSDITIQDEKPQVYEVELGRVTSRIGEYKIYRHGNQVSIRHFWKSSLTTMSETEEVPEFRILYNKKSLEPLLMEKTDGVEQLFSLGPIHVLSGKLRVIQGPDAGKVRKEGIIISVGTQ